MQLQFPLCSLETGDSFKVLVHLTLFLRLVSQTAQKLLFLLRDEKDGFVINKKNNEVGDQSRKVLCDMGQAVPPLLLLDQGQLYLSCNTGFKSHCL